MQEHSVVYLSGGVLGAVVLGMALAPLRDVTSASNLAFAFVVLVILVAELGGRGPALATALVSALSLDFFLTEPYLRLSIAKTDDVVAFFGLVVCGLVAAAFGTRREAQAEARKRIQEHLDLVREALRQVELPDPSWSWPKPAAASPSRPSCGTPRDGSWPPARLRRRRARSPSPAWTPRR
jgi:two-component system sensor histidine kinase KdpD